MSLTLGTALWGTALLEGWARGTLGSRRTRHVMSIEALMSAAHAAGYVMAAEDELPETFGTEPTVFDFKTQPSTAIAIWRPVVPADKPAAEQQGHFAHAWGWLAGRFVGGVTA